MVDSEMSVVYRRVSLLQGRVADPKLDEKKNIHRVESAKEYACQ
jgi:hypothetical protein